MSHSTLVIVNINDSHLYRVGYPRRLEQRADFLRNKFCIILFNLFPMWHERVTFLGIMLVRVPNTSHRQETSRSLRTTYAIQYIVDCRGEFINQRNKTYQNATDAQVDNIYSIKERRETDPLTLSEDNLLNMCPVPHHHGRSHTTE